MSIQIGAGEIIGILLLPVIAFGVWIVLLESRAREDAKTIDRLRRTQGALSNRVRDIELLIARNGLDMTPAPRVRVFERARELDGP